jgi:hypothetical protein
VYVCGSNIIAVTFNYSLRLPRVYIYLVLECARAREGACFVDTDPAASVLWDLRVRTRWTDTVQVSKRGRHRYYMHIVYEYERAKKRMKERARGTEREKWENYFLFITKLFRTRGRRANCTHTHLRKQWRQASSVAQGIATLNYFTSGTR